MSETIARQIQSEQVSLLYQQAKSGFVVTLAVAAVLGIILLRETGPSSVYMWWTAVILTTGLRFLSLRSFRKVTHTEPIAPNWKTVFVIGSTLSGLVWGLGGIAFATQTTFAALMLILLVVAAMAAGAIPYLGSILSAYLGFLLGATLPIAIWLLSQADVVYTGVGVLTCVFVAGLWTAAYRFNRVQTTSLRLKVEVETLACELRDSNDQLQRELRLLSKQEEALRDSEQRFRASFENGLVGMAVLSNDGYFLQVNDAYCRFVGYEAQELISQHYGLVVHVDDLDEVTSLVRKLQGGVTPAFQHQRRYRHKDGHVRWGLAAVSLLHGPDATQTGFIAQVQDVTERVQTEHERDRLVRTLETQNAELERFAYTISHDLKSPLITVRGFVDLLAIDLNEGDVPRAKEDLQRIFAATGQMRERLDNLLHLAQVGLRTNQPQLTSFRDVALEAVEILDAAITEHDVVIEVATELPDVLADPNRLAEAVQNLVENAIKFMGQQAEPRVYIGSRFENGETVLFVEDNGIGVDARFRDKIFELFERLDHSPEASGTGIGLAIVRRIVDSHGGRIWVEPGSSGSGSRFCFVLPGGDSKNGERTPPAQG